MSMTVTERRVQVLETHQFPAGHARLVKASSRHDRRRRFWVVEVLSAPNVGAEFAEYHWRVVEHIPVGEPDAEARAWRGYRYAWLTLRALGEVR
jgi:hypothetical protein